MNVPLANFEEVLWFAQSGAPLLLLMQLLPLAGEGLFRQWCGIELSRAPANSCSVGQFGHDCGSCCVGPAVAAAE